MCETDPKLSLKQSLIDKLLRNTISASGLSELCPLIDADDLAYLIQHIYDLNERSILDMAALTGAMRLFDNSKNNRRNSLFTQKMKTGLWNKKDHGRKIVLVEGDSWFNYPIILTDVIDSLSVDEKLAVYSLAKGGDWLLNMLTGRQYVEELSILFPDFFLISGGGNDIVGSRRLAAIIQSKSSLQAYNDNQWAQALMAKAEKKQVPLDPVRFNEGVGYLSKDFFALLMFFHLQYYFMMNGILNGGGSKPTKFPGIKILTQGYDFPIPSLNKGFGLNPLKWYIPFVRLFLGHGSWLKIPLQIRGIDKQGIQDNILYAMIYLFNEMMIEIGYCFNPVDQPKRVFHIDSRGAVGKHGWTDELHAHPGHFIDIGKVFSYCIHHHQVAGSATYDHVYVVKSILPKL